MYQVWVANGILNKSKKRVSIHLSLPPDCGCDQMLQVPCHHRLYFKPWVRINPSSLKSLLSKHFITATRKATTTEPPELRVFFCFRLHLTLFIRVGEEPKVMHILGKCSVTETQASSAQITVSTTSHTTWEALYKPLAEVSSLNILGEGKQKIFQALLHVCRNINQILSYLHCAYTEARQRRERDVKMEGCSGVCSLEIGDGQFTCFSTKDTIGGSWVIFCFVFIIKNPLGKMRTSGG